MRGNCAFRERRVRLRYFAAFAKKFHSPLHLICSGDSTDAGAASSDASGFLLCTLSLLKGTLVDGYATLSVTLVYTRFIPGSFRGFDRHVVENRRSISTLTGKAEYIAAGWQKFPSACL